ncbi:MAG: hypothetical protein JWL69_4006 [Phycisphaerales bacterium]|nr:hypothetical protein [Phycisphaerales bacterium]
MARITRQHGPVTNGRIKLHALKIGEAIDDVWRFSDLIEIVMPVSPRAVGVADSTGTLRVKFLIGN